MNTPDTELSALRGIGPKKVEAFRKLGVTTLRDLLTLFPRRYEDRSQFRPIALVLPDETVCIRAMVASEPRLVRIRRGMELVKLRAVDESGAVDITFFNQNYRKNNLHPGETYTFYGRVTVSGSKKAMANPVCEPEHSEGHLTGRIVPVYPLTAGLTQRVMLDAMRAALDACADSVPDALPPEIAERYRLAQARFAYENIHFPASFEALEQALRRLAFEELFLLKCGLHLLRSRRVDVAGPRCHAVDMQPFFDALPFPLTDAQRRAIGDAAADMASARPMNRLCQGDVGSGKTMVAAACVWFAAQSGWQSALMAPTEILARQHYENLAPLFERFGIPCALLTGSTRAKERRAILEGLADGSIGLCIGTHALLTADVQYQHLGLVVTDEQHRFGVAQRSALGQKAENPHMLVLSATPIPRTLALIIYGDLDVSIINELPPGRQKVDTFTVDERYRQRLNGFIRKQAAEGHQVFIVCPLVGDGDDLPDERKAVTAYARKLQTEVFPDLRIAALHGRMKPKEKDAVMAAFAAGEADILVSTTAVEVGVDVPNATLMVVENAEFFGLSQLHQLRGRVGRGKDKSYCVLVSQGGSEETKRRLKALTETNDGFQIAEEDLKLRGPGDFFGQRQHGLPALRIADLNCDMRLLDEAQTAAQELLAQDGDLSDPAHRQLKARIEELFEIHAEGLN